MKQTLVHYNEQTLRRVAEIMGDHSAAAKAVADIDARRDAGQTPVVYLDTKSKAWVVASLKDDGPRPA